MASFSFTHKQSFSEIFIITSYMLCYTKIYIAMIYIYCDVARVYEKKKKKIYENENLLLTTTSAALVVLPCAFLAVHEYRPASAAVALAISITTLFKL